LRQKGRSPLAFLASLRTSDGSYRYSRSSAQTPVWVTAQAIAAVRKKALPLKPVPRRVKRTRVQARRTPRAASGHAKPAVKRLDGSSRRRTASVPGASRRELAAQPVSEVRHGGEGSGGASVWWTIGIAAAALLAAAAFFAFGRRHV
jgi:hypothetical protein